MKASFTYYSREYELEFNEETQSGTIQWIDGVYTEFLGFYLLNGNVRFRARGKMANSVSKKMSKKKEQALLSKIKELCY